jgi:hypothetical protein
MFCNATDATRAPGGWFRPCPTVGIVLVLPPADCSFAALRGGARENLDTCAYERETGKA